MTTALRAVSPDDVLEHDRRTVADRRTLLSYSVVAVERRRGPRRETDRRQAAMRQHPSARPVVVRVATTDERIDEALLDAAAHVESCEHPDLHDALLALLDQASSPLTRRVAAALLHSHAGDRLGVLLDDALTAMRALGHRTDSHLDGEHHVTAIPDGSCVLCDDERADGLTDALLQLRGTLGETAIRDMRAAA